MGRAGVAGGRSTGQLGDIDDIFKRDNVAWVVAAVAGSLGVERSCVVELSVVEGDGVLAIVQTDECHHTVLVTLGRGAVRIINRAVDTTYRFTVSVDEMQACRIAGSRELC